MIIAYLFQNIAEFSICFHVVSSYLFGSGREAVQLRLAQADDEVVGGELVGRAYGLLHEAPHLRRASSRRRQYASLIGGLKSLSRSH